MAEDAYSVCRYVRHYHAKNGYLPAREMLDIPDEQFAAMVENGILEHLPLYDGGPLIKVALTDKGLRMATETRRRRR